MESEEYMNRKQHEAEVKERLVYSLPSSSSSSAAAAAAEDRYIHFVIAHVLLNLFPRRLRPCSIYTILRIFLLSLPFLFQIALMLHFLQALIQGLLTLAP